MASKYEVIIDQTESEGLLQITWYNVDKNTKDSFVSSAVDITQEELEKLWLLPQYQLDIGRKLFRLLDGEYRHFQRALYDAGNRGETMHLHLRTCKEVSNWPFELLAQGDTFLLPVGLMHLVRYVSDRGKEQKVSPKNRPLKLLFMACSAIDVKPELDFEREEEAIFEITEKLAIDMEIEDSGSLEGLRWQLERDQYDVLHLSGHSYFDENGDPYFVMEDETGSQHKVIPEELWENGLIENPPLLLFLSGFHTCEIPNTNSTVSFAHKLLENGYVPAVLSWELSVSDEQAFHAEKTLYHELSRGKNILDALQRTRYELIKQFPASENPSWPFLRLFSNSIPLNAIVTTGQRLRLQPRQMKYAYLKQSQIQVLAEGFVGRRRQLQSSLRVLKQDMNKVGVLLLGTAGLGKSCLAGRISERFTDHTLIVIHGKLNNITLDQALKDAFIRAQDGKGKKILMLKRDMTEKLAEMCATSFKERNYLILLDGFEQNLEGAEGGNLGPLSSETGNLLKTFLHYLPFSGKMTQLIITSRYEFSLTEQGQDLVKQWLEPIWLTSFHEAEQRKKAQELKNILNYPDQSIVPQLLEAGQGNPLLMEWLDMMVGQMEEADLPQLLDAISAKKEEFIQIHVIRKLLKYGGDQLESFLRRMSIFRRFIPKIGIQKLGEKSGLKNWQDMLQKGISLSLIEYNQIQQDYRLNPLLREELSVDLEAEETRTFHEAAYLYYKEICESQSSIDPILVEELIFHALRFGKEDMASKQGAKLVKYLREHLSFHESKRVGLWILEEKKKELSTVDDATLLNEIALILNEVGEYTETIGYYKKALSIDQSFYGEMHSNVARDLNNLGSVYNNLGDHLKAVEYFEQALTIIRTTPEDQFTHIDGLILNNLGEALHALGDHRKAIDYYEQALAIVRAVFGEKHPNVATILNNLGSTWAALGEYQKAINYYEHALTIDRSALGKKHPDVALSLNNLGSVWQDLGDLTKAVNYYEQALNILKEIFEEKHPNVASALNNLGSASKDLGDYKRAIDYYEQSLNILREIFGEKHPGVASTYNNLGVAWAALGEYQKAIDYYEKSLTIDKTVYGDKHPNVARELNNLGVAWATIGEFQKAIHYYEQALTIDKAVYGEIHPNVAKGLDNYGEALRVLGKPKEAITNFEKSLNISLKVFGEDHPDVARELNNLGSAWCDLGDNQKAIDHYEHALSIYKKLFGEEHPDVATNMHELGTIYFNMDQRDKAVDYFIKAHFIRLKFFGPDHYSTKLTAEWMQKDLLRLIEIEIDEKSGFLVNQEKELNLKVKNRSNLKLEGINIELDSAPHYKIYNKKKKYKVDELDGLEEKVIKVPIRVSSIGKIPLNLKFGDDYFQPAVSIYSSEDNPYIYGSPIKDIDKFFGRRKECMNIISEVCRETGPQRLVIGEQRSGKTSFLYFLKHNLHKPITPLYVSLEDMPGPKEKNNNEIKAYSWLLDRLIFDLNRLKILDGKKRYTTELKYGDYFRRNLAEIISDIKKKIKGFRLCLLFDEGNRILKFREDFQLVLRATLNELAKDLRLVLACSNEFLDYAQESKSSPLKNVFRYTFLEPLANSDLEDLITQPAARLGYRYENDAIALLGRLSGGHPYYCQALCSESFKIASRNNEKNITKEIVSDAKKKIVSSKEVRDKFIWGYWDFIKNSKKESRCLKAVIEQRTLAKKFNRTIEKLLNRRLIKEIGNRKYSITSELFHTWLCELLKIKKNVK